MGVLAWIIVGLIAGWLAKLVVPGREPGGFIATLLIGVAGAILGGWIWNLAFGLPGATGVDIGSIFVAFVGAVVLLMLYQVLVKGRGRA